MDPDGLPIVGAGVDYEQVGPIHQKRTLTFLNHFLIQTTTFLNHFSTICDEKLENLLIRIQRLEASMCILEAKLASIPGLDDVVLRDHDTISTQVPPAGQVQCANTVSQDNNQETPAPKAPEVEKVMLKISQVPRYAKYFKMVNMGVPIAAVKLKMSSEGVNADILDDPDAVAPSEDVASNHETDQSDSSEPTD